MLHSEQSLQSHAIPTGRAQRSMMPKEHGAWGQLLLPLLVALGSARVQRLEAWGLAVAAMALFVAHEPFVIWLGQRGTRAARDHSVRALRHVGGWVLVAAVSGGAALLNSDYLVLGAAAAVLSMAVVFVLVFLIRGTERSTQGELWLAFIMPGAAIPAALATRAPLISAATAWASFALAFSAGVLSVRGIIRWHKQRDTRAGWTGLGTVLIGVVGLAVLAPRDGLAALLFWLFAVACRALKPALKGLKRVGWCLVAGSVLQAAVLVSTRLHL